MIDRAMAQVNPLNIPLTMRPHRVDLFPNRMFLMNHSQALHVTAKQNKIKRIQLK